MDIILEVICFSLSYQLATTRGSKPYCSAKESKNRRRLGHDLQCTAVCYKLVNDKRGEGGEGGRRGRRGKGGRVGYIHPENLRGSNRMSGKTVCKIRQMLLANKDVI